VKLPGSARQLSGRPWRVCRKGYLVREPQQWRHGRLRTQQGAGDFEQLGLTGVGIPPQPGLQGGGPAQGQFGSAGAAIASNRIELAPEKAIHARMLT